MITSSFKKHRRVPKLMRLHTYHSSSGSSSRCRPVFISVRCALWRRAHSKRSVKCQMLLCGRVRRFFLFCHPATFLLSFPLLALRRLVPHVQLDIDCACIRSHSNLWAYIRYLGRCRQDRILDPWDFFTIQTFWMPSPSLAVGCGCYSSSRQQSTKTMHASTHAQTNP